MIKKPFQIALILILCLSLILNIYNNQFPIGYHDDEGKKVYFIEENIQDLHHPVLMLQIVRTANFFFRFTESQKIVVLGRIIMAIFGTMIVLLSYLISKKIFKKKYALIVAFAVSISPIIVIHSHYLKEDIIFACFALLSLLSLIKLIEKPNKLNSYMLGISTGLALSSQYKGVLLLLIYLIVPLIIPSIRNLKYYANILLSILVSLGIFILVNFVILFDFEVFREGISWEMRHVLVGHFLRIYPIQLLFGFHLSKSIVPGMTSLLTSLALVSIIYCLIRWKKVIWQDKILLLYVFLFYFSAEISPSKPFPDFMRYTIPIIPILVYFAYKIIFVVYSSSKSRMRRFIILLIVLTLSTPLYETIQLDYNLNKDTREIAKAWIDTHKETTRYECNVWTKCDVAFVADLDIEKERNKGINYFMASSFRYDRYLWGYTLKNQHKEVYSRYNKYNLLFGYPYVEIKPAYKSFAFSNPTIRIIDIRK